MSDRLTSMTHLKLVDLEPRWTVGSDEDCHVDRQGMGIGFNCPIHRNHRLVVFFSNPIDGGQPCKSVQFLWGRTGETFETLTLKPSIDASSNAVQFGDGMIQTPCWHGFVTNGEVT